MRRLTLILSDLYLPADAARESFPTMLQLPAMDWLLRYARREPIGDWRAWLARDLGASDVAQWPPAHFLARALGVEPAGCWIATPVVLEARLDHVRLADRGVLHLSSEHSAMLAEEFAASLGPESLMAGPRSGALLLRGGPNEQARTVDPATLLDSDVGSALPQGAAAAALRRLGAEIEMWLPGTRTNAARARAGMPRITALWLWGGGEPARPAATGTSSAPREGLRDGALHGDDAFVDALRRFVGARSATVAPDPIAKRFADLHTPDAHVALSPMSGPDDESLASLEANWFEPARAALRSGALRSLRLVANGMLHETTPRARWKWWRRQRGWLESLA